FRDGPERSQPGSAEASSTARRLLSSPAPCSVAGPPRSGALDSRSCLTAAGAGRAPWCAFAYAWITSAAAPATSGADWLVPPLSSTGDGLPRKLTQEE